MLRKARNLWRNLVNRSRVERELDEEVRCAFELLVDEKRRAGMTETDARRAATTAFGRIESVKMLVRDAKAGASWDVFQQDLRYGARLLARNPLFALTATLSLAICIGANTAVFSIANRLLFGHAAGVPDAGRLVDIAPARSDASFAEPAVAYSLYRDIPSRLTTFDGVYAHQLDLSAMSLRASTGADRIFGAFVSSNYFSVLRIAPAAGRLISPQDGEGAGAAPIVVLSHGFWMRRFNGDRAVVGRALHINGQPLTIVGVTPGDFHGLGVLMPDVWLPANTTSLLAQQSADHFGMGGRLRDGVSRAEAAAEIDAIGRGLYAAASTGTPVGARENRATSLRLARASPVPPIVRVAVSGVFALLLGVVGLVLVIACANIAGVLLARATARHREIAVRIATGARPSRIVRQLLTETMLLFVLGGAAGLAVARVATSLILLALPALPVPVDTSLPLDRRVVAFTMLTTLIAALVSGVAPARHASTPDVITALKADSQGPPDRLRLRSLFVVAQVALSIVLVVCAGLLLRALQRSASTDLGFNAEGVEVTTLDLSLGGYNAATGPLFVQQLLDRLRATPGVSASSAAMTLPLRGRTRMCCGVLVPGVAAPDGQSLFQPAWNVVAPGYFSTLGIRLVAGRDFTTADRDGTEPVAIISETAAQQFWPGQEAVGRYVMWQKAPRLLSRQQNAAAQMSQARLTIIAVAADVQTGGTRPAPLVYVPFHQQYDPNVAVIARSNNGARLTTEIRDAVASINPYLPVIAASRLTDATGPVHLQLRLSAAVAAAVGAVALLLAAIGVFGVTAYTVTRRTREIGIRLALGARRPDIVRMVLRQGMAMMATGSIAGLLLAAIASRLLKGLLFGVPPLDPVSFGAAVLLFGATGLAACYVPVRRATRVQAVEALRCE